MKRIKLRQFNVVFATENAAFENFPEAEVARILDSIRAAVEEGSRSGKVFDVNGNAIGRYEFSGGSDETNQ